MLAQARSRGIKPDFVVVDAWYSSLYNLKCIRSFDWHWVAGIRKNRKVNRNEILENLDIPKEGLRCHLHGYGWVTVFRFVMNERRTDYIATNADSPTRGQIENIMKMRWNIEVYHQELKQTCSIERCMSRAGRAQRNLFVLLFLPGFIGLKND